MPTHKNHVVDLMIFLPNLELGDDEIINALEALGCIVIGIHRDQPINSQLITVLPIRPKKIKAPSL